MCGISVCCLPVPVHGCSMFENSVEVHIQHIMTGLYQRGSLYQYSMAQAQLPQQVTHQPQVQQQQQLFHQQHRTVPLASAAASSTGVASRSSSVAGVAHPGIPMTDVQPILNPALSSLGMRQSDHLSGQHQQPMSFVAAASHPRAF